MIVDELEGEALQAVNLNNLRGILHIVAVQAPTHGENRQRELEDMEAMVGGQAITGTMASVVEKVTEDVLGHAERVVVEKNKTTIVGGNSNAEKTLPAFNAICANGCFNARFTMAIPVATSASWSAGFALL